MSSNSAFMRGEGTLAAVRRWMAELRVSRRSTNLFHHRGGKPRVGFGLVGNPQVRQCFGGARVESCPAFVFSKYDGLMASSTCFFRRKRRDTYLELHARPPARLPMPCP